MAPRRKNETGRSSGLRWPVGTRELRRRVLIVCEGERTEPNYFSAFRSGDLDVEVVRNGGDAFNVVDLAVRYADKPPSNKLFHEIWCVFDRDEVPPERFNRALERAEHNSIHVAYSNPCFELWYLLHFQYADSRISRKDFSDKLTGAIETEYQKNMPDTYTRLETRQAQAIRHAKRLLQEYDPPSPANDDPSTTVHLLVETLNRYRQR